MNITVKFKENNLYFINFLKFGLEEENIIISSTESSCENGITYMRNVTFNKGNTPIQGNTLIGLDLKELQIYDPIKKKFSNWVEIESILVEDYDLPLGKFYINSAALIDFKTQTIPGFGIISERDFQTIVTYAHIMEEKVNALQALNNRENDWPKNIINYLKESIINEFAKDFDSVRDYSGEDEYYQIESFINKNGGIIYAKFISYKGLPNEKQQKASLMKSQLAKIEDDIKKYRNNEIPEISLYEWPTIYDENGRIILLKFVDAVEY